MEIFTLFQFHQAWTYQKIQNLIQNVNSYDDWFQIHKLKEIDILIQQCWSWKKRGIKPNYYGPYDMASMFAEIWTIKGKKSEKILIYSGINGIKS